MQTCTDLKAGVIEGFFGRPWAWPARLSGADFLRDCGYQFYIYAPKSDSFLRRRWREPLPAQTLWHLSELGSRRDSVDSTPTHAAGFSISMKRRDPTPTRKRSPPGCAVNMCSIHSV